MTNTDKTANEVFESLNGFDEIAIKKMFGQTMNSLTGPDEAVMWHRALIFTEQRRAGLNDHAAWEHAMGLVLADVKSYFLDEPDEPMPSQPLTESGKDASQTESEPTT